MMSLRTCLLSTLLPLLLLACSDGGETAVEAPAVADTPAPVEPRGKGIITTANPHATDAGAEMLRRGGTAVDAAIAAHAVLGLVEPQSSGIGGGGFMLVHDAQSSATEFLDGRETAPTGARADMFLDDTGAPLPFVERIQSGHSVGVPGAIALYALAHERHGRLPWAELFAPAIALAEEGFAVSPRLHQVLVRISGFTDIEERSGPREYFFPDGAPIAIGTPLKNPQYAAVLRAVAEEGPSAFYSGDIVDAIVTEAALPPRGGALAAEDFAAYEARVREPLCSPWRSWRVCSAPPPSSGVAVLQIVSLLERLAPDGAANDVEGWSAFIDAMLLAYADRDHYVADSDFVDVPLAELLDARYLDARAEARTAPGTEPGPGDPGAVLGGAPIIDRWGRDATEEVGGTSHLSVMDADGNAVAFTASVEFIMGSQRMASGFILNNELTDFSSVPEINGQPVANAVEPGKRPRSSMSPTIVFDADGKVRMVTGSPGGNSIIAYTAKSLLGVLEFGLDPQDAVNLPNVIARDLPVRVENGAAPAALLEAIRQRGYPVDDSRGETSGLHVILVDENGVRGAADARREGTVAIVPAAP